MKNIDKYKHLNPNQLRLLALEEKIILASPRGMEAIDARIEAAKDEIAREKQILGEAARNDSDLPENTQFKEAKIRLQFELPKKLNDLNAQRARTLIFTEPQDGRIRFGTKFSAEVVYAPDDKESDEFQLLGPLEGSYLEPQKHEPRVLSYLTPLGRRLWGHDPATSQSVDFDTPGGQAKCNIKNIYR